MKSGKMSRILIGMAAAGFLASTAIAGPTQLKFTDTTAWGQPHGGGPFEVVPIGFGTMGVEGLGAHGAAANAYLSFCIELDESIGTNTYDAVVNTEAVNGGVGGGNPDPLDARTAFLFTAFIKGSLDDKLADAGLDPFTYGAMASGEAMQDVIWLIEEEKADALTGLAADLLTLADAAVGQGGEWEGKGIGSVRILNLTRDGRDNQDQLILIPLPIPALLGLVGLGGVMLMRRRHGA